MDNSIYEPAALSMGPQLRLLVQQSCHRTNSRNLGAPAFVSCHLLFTNCSYSKTIFSDQIVAFYAANFTEESKALF